MDKTSLNMVPKPIGLLFIEIVMFTIIKPGRIDPFITPLARVIAIYKTFSFNAIQI